MKILIHYPFEAEQIEALRGIAQLNGDHELVAAEDDQQAVELAPGSEVMMGHFKPDACAAAPELRWVQSFSAGMDKFLFDAIIERDEVSVSNMAGLYAPQGGEHAWALLLALTRGIAEAVRHNARREWGGGATVELTGKTLGLIGLGGFGMEMVKRAAGYDMHIIAVDPVRRDRPEGVDELKDTNDANLLDLLERSDVVMLACPRTDETYHLIGSNELKAMKQSAYLINVTRGGIIDEQALFEALRDGEIAGAGLDVVEKEPLDDSSPLWDAPNIIFTPHRAGASQHRPRKVHEFFCRQLERYLKGETPLNLVDKKRGF